MYTCNVLRPELLETASRSEELQEKSVRVLTEMRLPSL